MRVFTVLLEVIFAYFLARYVGKQIIAGHSIIVAVLFVAIPLFLYLTLRQKFILLSLSALIPLNFPQSFYLPLNGWIEVIAPIVCLLLIIEVFSEKRPLVSSHAFLFFLAITVIVTWAIVNYIKNPVSGEISLGASYERRGLRNYFIIFVGLTTFLSSFLYFRYKEIDLKRWFYLLGGIALLIGYLRIIGYYEGFYLPIFHITSQSLIGGTAGYQRITISGGMGALGVTLLMCLSYGRKWKPLYTFLIAGYLILIIFSAGRATMFGLSAGIIAYLLFVSRRFFIPILLSAFLVIIVFSTINIFVNLHGQIERLISVKTVSPGSFSSRYYTSLYAWKLFTENPLFGKGIGHVKTEENDEYLRSLLKNENKWDRIFLINHIKRQIAMGGHGTYTSIMVIFGMGGIFFISIMVFGSMYYAYRIFKDNRDNDYIASLALFGFIYMVMLSLFLVPGGSGYNDMRLWFFAGMIAGLKVRAEERAFEVVKEEKEEYSGERLLWAEE